MKVVITGVTGLLGMHVLEKFLSLEGFEVFCTIRDPNQKTIFEEKGAKCILLDLSGSEESFSVLNEFKDSLWIHCAAAVSGAEEDVLQKVNVDGTQNLINRANELNVRFIHISSITVYGLGKGDFKETDQRNPVTKYAITKVLAEDIVKQSKTKWTILRPPYIGGPGDRNFFVEIGRRVEAHKIPLISENGVIAVVDARDVASAIVAMIDNDEATGQIYNIQGETMNYKQFVILMGDTIGAGEPYFRKYPYWVIYLMGSMADLWAKMRGKTNERGISRYRVKNFSSVRTMSINKIKADLGFEPEYSIEQSVRDWVETRD